MASWVDFAALKREVGLAPVLQQYDVQLRRSGRDQYRGRCPIHHGEGGDAFHANLSRNIFHCFSCGAGGTVLDFVAAIYHAMTLRVEKRFSQGLSFLGAYTAGKSIDDGSAIAWWEGPTTRSFLDHYNRRLERSISSWDVAQRFVVNYLYELPFGKGKP